MNLRITYILIIFLISLFSCSSTENISQISDNKGFPSWYSNSNFQSDATSFFGFGMAIASDSSVAINRAITEANKNLDLAIGKMTEDVRKELLKEGISSVENTDFILILRNAHADVSLSSELINKEIVEKEGIYRAFTQVNLTKKIFQNILEKGFKGHPKYWATFSGNELFGKVFE